VGVALTAEFTAVGDLFEIVIGTLRWPIVVIIGVISAIYTAYGGLYVSIVTDQASSDLKLRFDYTSRDSSGCGVWPESLSSFSDNVTPVSEYKA